MKIKSESAKPSKKKTSVLCAFVFENSNEPLGLGKVNEKINSSVKDAVKETKGKIGGKWRAFGWNVIDIDGHRVEQIDNAIKKANQAKGVPSIIIARTIKGKGVEHMEDNPQWHGKAPKPEMVPIINAELESPSTLNPNSSTLNPNPSNLNPIPKPSILNTIP